MTEQQPTPIDDDLPEQMRIRRHKREELLESDTPPYPRGFSRTHTLDEVRATYPDLEPGTETGDRVAVAGRVIFLRNTGKLCFARIREGSGSELQIMLSLDRVGEARLQDWKHVVDIGDLIGVAGDVVSSKRGELSVAAQTWVIVSKALRPLPVAHKALNEETRIRQRYVDLIVNPEARDMVRTRATVVRSLRETLHDHGYLEVETPVLQTVHGGAAARPFETHLNAFDLSMTLRIALELYLKRAIVGGVDKVYEIGRIFRNEGVDSTHSPEFTMLEAYEAYGDYDTMAALTRELVLGAARSVGRTVVSDGKGAEIDLEAPWVRVTLHEAVANVVGEDVTIDTSTQRLRELAAKHDVEVQPGWGHGEIVLELFEKLVEHTITTPTFVCDYPESVRPLARPHRDDPRLVEAWDLIIAGVELAPAYSELVDPVVQRARLEAQSLLAAAGDPEAMQVDEDFLRALEYGMPPTGGMGLGVDRLVMLLTGAGIRETILFPLVKPE
ncbi:lysine--tRNA ligase [Phytoactinopolyspora halotolerans]|uniref:Lysine--tRNA ligase n=1 Tax=Phytoactinopolyspora halotolerans TaxID=1981512 RepID=A0A6L9S253_9ACTN|nr:lysine--tRNA ligase [Phytoactinopolyspora halotolerans]NED98860.1 lysine--tRNA ligase [Phytoactinopolyspora halotolerans]